MEKRETSIIQCKVCKEVKTRFLAGKWKNCKKWVDENNRLFNGKTCPSCTSARIREYMKKLREARKEIEEEANAKISDNS